MCFPKYYLESNASCRFVDLIVVFFMYRYLISSLNLILVILCCVYLDDVEVLGVIIWLILGLVVF